MLLARIRLGFGILLFLAVALFLHYSLPSRDIVRIVGTDVVRTDVEGRDAQGNTITVSRDVRFINAKWPDGRDRVYRNEDTGWGWPPYFKFDTADLAAETRRAAIVVAALGKAGAIGPEHIGDGAVVIDVGINRVDDRAMVERLFPSDPERRRAFEKKGYVLTGDVDFHAAGDLDRDVVEGDEAAETLVDVADFDAHGVVPFEEASGARSGGRSVAFSIAVLNLTGFPMRLNMLTIEPRLAVL